MAKVIKFQKVTYRLELSSQEFNLLKALLQNPHPAYTEQESTVIECEALFNTFMEAENE